MEFDINKLIRNNIKNLTPYSSARNEFKGEASVFLDANENNNGSPLSEKYNRYPDPYQWQLKQKISNIKGVPAQNIFLGNGSDEAIDILLRVFCRPGMDNIIIPSPTYGMYEVSANINDVEVRKANLTGDFQLNTESISELVDENSRLIFICSPNNPTGNSFDRDDIEFILNNFNGIVVIDEAYINFSKYKSFISELTEYPNLVVLQTLSKAWGLAGLRVGMAFASKQIIDVFNKVKAPYNVNSVSQRLAIDALENIETVNDWIKETVSEREKIITDLALMPFVLKVFPSDSNFILVKTSNPKKIYDYLVSKGLIVRDRSKVMLCEGCLRITIGTKYENTLLLKLLKEINL